jgi:pSer/pThr/pTyr-binding forkhead associated (FHA) protein
MLACPLSLNDDHENQGFHKMSLQLLVILGPNMGQSFSLGNERPIVIGRGDDCSVQLDDPRISRNHCQILVEGGRATLRDLGSSWGTMVNGNKISNHNLQPGDVIELSETKLRFEVGSNAAAVTWAPNSTDDDPPPKLEQPKPAPLITPTDEAPALKSPQPIPLTKPIAEPKASSAPASPSPSALLKLDDTKGPTQPGEDLLDTLIGETVHRYHIVKAMAKSKTGVLFRAVDTKKHRAVTLQVLWPHISQNEDDVQRFVRSIDAMRVIKHPNLVALYGAGITMPGPDWAYTQAIRPQPAKSICWFAAELVNGCTLEQLMKKERPSWRVAAGIARDIAGGLVTAADHGVVHRNITPSSILIREEDGIAKLGDLVLAKALEGTDGERLTKPGETVGELPFLAPESLFDEPLDLRSDIYSLGITIYTALAGTNPFLGKSVTETISNVINLKPPTLRFINKEIPIPLEKLVFRMIASQKDQRPSHPQEVVNELQAILDTATD